MELNQERFEAWLFSQPPERVIESTNPNDCFLCSFLKETTNIHPTVSWETWTDVPNARKIEKYDLPKWSKELINTGDFFSQFPDRRITVEQMQERYISLFGHKDLPLPGEGVQGGTPLKATKTTERSKPRALQNAES